MNYMKNQEIPLLSVYYDGLCRLCSKEIDHYKKQEGANHIKFIDITSTNFEPSKENVDPVSVHKIMHVKLKDGSIVTKVDAFIEIWKVLPKFNKMAQLAKFPLLKAPLNIGYEIFAMIRPYLPRKNSNSCDESPYCEKKHV